MNTTELSYKPLKMIRQQTNPSAEDQSIIISKSVSDQKTISSLFVTDLPFTADSALKAGIPIVGYKGITNQYSENLQVLHPDFAQLLQEKKVSTIVLVYNSDVLDHTAGRSCPGA